MRKDNKAFSEEFKRRIYRFIIDTVRFTESLPKYDSLCKVVINQLLRSATSIGANYVEAIAGFSSAHIRLCLKAGTPEGWNRRTGATKESFEIPYNAVRYLLDAGVSFHVASMSADPRFMGQDERIKLQDKLGRISPKLLTNLEEEVVDPYDTTLFRLSKAGMEDGSE